MGLASSSSEDESESEESESESDSDSDDDDDEGSGVGSFLAFLDAFLSFFSAYPVRTFLLNVWMDRFARVIRAPKPRLDSASEHSHTQRYVP